MASRSERIEAAAKWVVGELEGDGSHGPDAIKELRAALAAGGSFNEEAERQQATDALARECFDGPTPSARDADLWIEGWLMRARYAHPTTPASAAGGENARLYVRIGQLLESLGDLADAADAMIDGRVFIDGAGLRLTRATNTARSIIARERRKA